MSDTQNEQDLRSYEERMLEERAKSKRSSRRGKGDDGPSLNINSMMDIMVIILCFLLFSVGADPLNIKQSDDLRLPQTISQIAPEATLTITVSRTYVLVDDRQVLSLNDGEIDPQDLVSAQSMQIPELQREIEESLTRQVEQQQRLGREPNPVATLVVHNATPFETIARVMASANQGGVQNFRFAVIRRGLSEAYAAAE